MDDYTLDDDDDDAGIDDDVSTHDGGSELNSEVGDDDDDDVDADDDDDEDDTCIGSEEDEISEDEADAICSDDENDDVKSLDESKGQKRKFVDFDEQLDSANSSLRALKKLAVANSGKDDTSDATDGILSNEDFQRIKELKVSSIFTPQHIIHQPCAFKIEILCFSMLVVIVRYNIL